LTSGDAPHHAYNVTTEHQVPPGFAEAIEQFNSWRFYDCHETLEDIWREVGAKSSESELANFYQGIIKAAAGYHHLLRENYEGTLKVLGDTARLLSPYRPQTLGLNVDALLDAINVTLDTVNDLGPQRLKSFDRALIPTIDWTRPA
jgi:predicted metal-dependent hydrolase